MFKFVTCTLLFWTAVPFLIPILTVLYIYRGFVILLQKIIYPKWIGILSPRDMVVWEKVEKRHLHCVMANVLTLGGETGAEFDLEKFQNHFMDRVISYRNPRGEFSYSKLQYYYENWMGFPFWKKEERFDIKKHIRFLTPLKDEDSSKSESKVLTEEQVHKMIGTLITQPFEAKTSPWEFLIVPKFQPKNCGDKNKTSNSSSFAVILRVHHTLFDGYSYYKMLLERICGETSFTRLAESAPSQPKFRARGIFGRVQRILEILVNLGMYHAQFFILDRDVNIWHGNGKGNKKLTGLVHTIKCEGVPFSVPRGVSKKLGVAPTATLFSCVAGGIRRYLEMEQAEIPEKITGFFPWPVENHPMDGLVNHWSFTDIGFLTGEADPVKRIKKTNDNFQALKNSPFPKLVWKLSPFFSSIPTPFFNILGWNRKSTLALTNFPGYNITGERQFLVFGTWKFLDRVSFLGRLRGSSAVQFSVSTENGTVFATIAADRGILSEENTKQLAGFITQEFKGLEFLV